MTCCTFSGWQFDLWVVSRSQFGAKKQLIVSGKNQWIPAGMPKY